MVMDWLGLVALSTSLLATVVTGRDFGEPRTFVLNMEPMAWQDGSHGCLATNGSLATLYDLSTIADLWITESLSHSEGWLWVGLRRTDTGAWRWEDGSDLGWQNWQVSGGDPTPGDCVAASIHFPNQWRPTNCSDALPVLCEYDKGNCTFHEFPNTIIRYNNIMDLYGKTLQECKDVCRTTRNFVCQSFEYRSIDGQCQFNSGNMWSLHSYLGNLNGWDYFHLTCNTGEVIWPVSSSPVLESSSPALSSSSPMWSSSSPMWSSSSPMWSSSSPAWSSSSSSKVFITTSCVEVVQTVTVQQRSTSLTTASVQVTLTPDLNHLMSSVVVAEEEEEEPVEELTVLVDTLKERKKELNRVSYRDNRPSARYVGYIAIAFMSCVFGSIVLFDLLSLCRYSQFSWESTAFWRWGKVLQVTTGKAEERSRKKSTTSSSSERKAAAGNSRPRQMSTSAELEIYRSGCIRSKGERLWRDGPWNYIDEEFAESTRDDATSLHSVASQRDSAIATSESCSVQSTVFGETGQVEVEVLERRGNVGVPGSSLDTDVGADDTMYQDNTNDLDCLDEIAKVDVEDYGNGERL